MTDNKYSQRSMKYNATHTKRYHLAMNLKTDSDIIEYLDGLSNKQGFIKSLIRKHMSEEQTRSED